MRTMCGADMVAPCPIGLATVLGERFQPSKIQIAYILRGVLVCRTWPSHVMRAIDLRHCLCIRPIVFQTRLSQCRALSCAGCGILTARTRSDVMISFLAMLSINSALVAPVHLQAIMLDLCPMAKNWKRLLNRSSRAVDLARMESCGEGGTAAPLATGVSYAPRHNACHTFAQVACRLTYTKGREPERPLVASCLLTSTYASSVAPQLQLNVGITTATQTHTGTFPACVALCVLLTIN